MNRDAERTLHEIAEKTGQLRTALAQMEEHIERASSAHRDEASRLSQHVQAISVHVSALEKRAVG